MSLDEIAARLREAREYRHLSLAAVSKATRIHIRHIQALEAGDLRALPGRTYTRAFLRTYASYLALDADELLDLLPPSAERAPRGFPKPPAVARSITGALLFWSIVAGLSLVFLCVGWAALQSIASRDTTTNTQSVLTAPTPDAPAGSLDLPPPPTPTPLVALIVRATDRAPLSVVVDGAAAFSDTLQAGDARGWNANRAIQIRTTNAGAFDVTYNGVARGPMGKKNEAAALEWTAANATPQSIPSPSPGPSPTASPRP